MSFRAYIKAFSKSFGRPDFQAAIVKWAPLIENTAFNASRLTKQDMEDTLQSLLLDLSSVYDYFASPLYRYNGRVWKLKERRGRLALLVSPDHILKPLKPCWVYWASLEPVKKSSASAFVYRRIVQFVPDLATKHFRKRNGFDIHKKQKVVLEKTGISRSLKTKEVFVPTETYRTVSFSDPQQLSDTEKNPEDDCSSLWTFNGVSSSAKQVAEILVKEGKCGDARLGKRLKLDIRIVRHAKAEIYRVLKQVKHPAGVHPVYFSAEQVLCE